MYRRAIMPKTKKEHYTLAELSKKFNRAEQTIWAWVNTGKIKSVRPDGFKHLVPVSELETVEALCSRGKRQSTAKRKSNKRKASDWTPAQRTEPVSGRIGRPAASAAIRVTVPAKLSDLYNSMGGDLQSAVQKTVDEFCNATVENLKNFN